MVTECVAIFGPMLGAQVPPTPGGFFDTVGETQNWMPGAVAALGIALITATLLRRWMKRNRVSRQREPKRVLSDQRQQLQHRAERDSLEKLMVEVQDLTRLCAAQIENRASKLEHLIQLADQRLQQLDRATQPSPAHSPRSTRPDHRHNFDNTAVSKRTERTQDWSAEADEEPVIVTRQRDQLAERVHDLSAMGLSSIEIARQLEEQVGKVELILALREAS
jgi:hypothetical protein